MWLLPKDLMVARWYGVRDACKDGMSCVSEGV